MDTLTHTVLGATIGHVVAGRRLGRAALLLGALAANAPDLDVFLRFPDPLLTHQLHRHFTHALVMIPVLAALAVVPFLLSRRLRREFPRLLLLAVLACATHTLLDACTSYGTCMLWPFTDARISWDLVSVIDSLVTVPLLIASILALRRWGARVSLVALVFVACYLGLGDWQHRRAMDALRALGTSRGHTPAAARVMPTMGNIVLWRSLYQHDHRIQCDAIRVLPGAAVTWREGESVPLVTTDDLPGAAPADVDAFRRFAWFADGYVAAAPDDPGVLADMRYSLRASTFAPIWGVRLPRGHAYGTWVTLGGPRGERMAKTLWRDVFSTKGYRPIEAVTGPQTPHPPIW